MTGDKGIARASAAAALLALSVSAGGCRQPGVPRVEPEVRALGAGVTLAIAADRPPAPLARRGLVPLWVTVTNQGPDPVRLRYRDFALADDDSLADAALLPAELGLPPASARLLPERLVGRGESAPGFVNLRRPARPPPTRRAAREAANEPPSSRRCGKRRVD